MRRQPFRYLGPVPSTSILCTARSQSTQRILSIPALDSDFSFFMPRSGGMLFGAGPPSEVSYEFKVPQSERSPCFSSSSFTPFSGLRSKSLLSPARHFCIPRLMSSAMRVYTLCWQPPYPAFSSFIRSSLSFGGVSFSPVSRKTVRTMPFL